VTLRAPPPRLVAAFNSVVPGALQDFVNRVNAIRGVTVATSWWRDPITNAQVGGSRDSQHLFALGVDVTGDLQQITRDARALGLIPVSYLNHVHLQGWPAGVARRTGFLDFLGFR